VGTLQWNTQAHLEAYLAVPCMGAVLHTLNLRLFPERLAFIVKHAEDARSSSTARSRRCWRASRVSSTGSSTSS
jgi:acyl-CoA synthetase (AMP-forming)/AMP-acid ligase II